MLGVTRALALFAARCSFPILSLACVFVTSACLNPSLPAFSFPPSLLYPPTHSRTRYSQTALRGISPFPAKGFTQDETAAPIRARACPRGGVGMGPISGSSVNW